MLNLIHFVQYFTLTLFMFSTTREIIKSLNYHPSTNEFFIPSMSLTQRSTYNFLTDEMEILSPTTLHLA